MEFAYIRYYQNIAEHYFKKDLIRGMIYTASSTLPEEHSAGGQLVV
jgi:hypothetical protein